MITVADKIGKDYKKWENYNKVFISAPTGSGKTYFILNVLLPYACSQNKKILFLVNRKILKTQMETEISIFPFEIAQSIRVETYQTIEKQLCEIRSDIQSKYIGVAGNKALKKRYEGFDYVVCDECHYFLTDSNYNTNTEVSFRWIQDVFANKVRIFMSATINEIREFVNKDDKRKEYQSSHFYHKQFETTDTLWHVAKRKEVYEYLIEKDYKYVDVHIIEDRDDIVDIAIESKEKWLIFVDSIVYGKSLERNLNAKLGDVEKKKSVVLVTTDYKRDEESAKEVAEIAKTSMFSANILITTSVLDNGVNIKDIELRNLVVCADTEDEFIQMLGRKRQDGRKTSLYILKRSKKHFQQRMAELEKARIIASKYQESFASLEKTIPYTKVDDYNQKESWAIWERHCKLMSKMADNELDYADVMKVFRVYEGVLLLNLVAFEHLEHLRDCYIKTMKRFDEEGEDAFVKEQLEWLGKTTIEVEKIVNDSKYSQLEKDRERVIEAIRQKIDKPMDMYTIAMFKMSIREELKRLVEEIECDEKKKKALKDDLGKTKRPLSAPQMKLLKEYCGIPYEIKVKNGIYTIIEAQK
ncbi:MAG: DEAD/DEAH box helicase family protein [Clostridiales bacterium]|nr:DEAD/DEAH box helicase family protein [Clostridiales bacterium]